MQPQQSQSETPPRPFKVLSAIITASGMVRQELVGFQAHVQSMGAIALAGGPCLAGIKGLVTSIAVFGNVVPHSAARNIAVDEAQQRGADVLVMLDDDMGPVTRWFDEAVKEIWLNLQKGRPPIVIASPYCTGGEKEDPLVFRYRTNKNNYENSGFQMSRYTREEAAAERGLVEVENVGPGCIAYDMRAFSLIKKPYYEFMWADDAHTIMKASEDIFCHQQMRAANVHIFADFDNWSSHFKVGEITQPKILHPSQVDTFREKMYSILRMREEKERTAKNGVAKTDAASDLKPERIHIPGLTDLAESLTQGCGVAAGPPAEATFDTMQDVAASVASKGTAAIAEATEALRPAANRIAASFERAEWVKVDAPVWFTRNGVGCFHKSAEESRINAVFTNHFTIESIPDVLFPVPKKYETRAINGGVTVWERLTAVEAMKKSQNVPEQSRPNHLGLPSREPLESTGEKHHLTESQRAIVEPYAKPDPFWEPFGYCTKPMRELYHEVVRDLAVSGGGSLVEVGSLLGQGITVLARATQQYPKQHWFLYAVDHFQGSDEQVHREIISKLGGKTLRQAFDENLRRAGVSKLVQVKEGKSADVAGAILDNCLDFVFIDASHDYQSVVQDIQAWLPKVKPGGILAGHDYTAAFPGVVEAVDGTFRDTPAAVRGDCWVWRKPKG